MCPHKCDTYPFRLTTASACIFCRLYIFLVLAQDLIGISTPMSPQRSQPAPELNEETPLLHDANQSRRETPLPIAQITILLLVQLTEPLTSLAIRPYINQVRLPIPITQVVGNLFPSLSGSSQSLVVTNERSDTTQG